MTIRFIPDTLRDALWRPISMAAPSSQVYVETISPDLRFIFIGLILLSLMGFLTFRRLTIHPALKVVLGLVLLSFVPWLATSGNGRYFIPVLLLAGPLGIGLLAILPLTRWMKASLAALLLGLQSFVVLDADPFGVWAMAQWREAPYFHVEIPVELKKQPHTYVTTSSISYSLIAPQFHSASRWLNVSNLGEASEDTADQRKTQALLKESDSIKLVLPVVPAYRTQSGQPSEALRVAIEQMLAAQRLELVASKECQVMQSRGMASIIYRDIQKATPTQIQQAGFWLCDVRWNQSLTILATRSVQNDEVNKVFDAVEQSCPRLFAPGQKQAIKLDGGYMRLYGASDMKLYVMDDGWVYYKYWMGLNPMEIAKIEDVTAQGFKMPCNKIRGRSGLPWEREI